MHSGILAVLFVLFLAFDISQCASLPAQKATVCNGHAELCSRSYANVTFAGSHDSFAIDSNPLNLPRDQAVDIPTQLQLGIRLLQAQAHDDDGELHFCHTSCLLYDGGKVVDYLKLVKAFLDANPNEVITLIFTNPEGLSVKNVWKPAFDDAGISPLAYVPPHVPLKYSEWPTLGEMIDSGKRVVVFLDANAENSGVDFILPEFSMIWETPFSVVDPEFPCSIDRIHGPLSAKDHLYMINHSLNKDLFDTGIIISDPIDAPVTNSVASIIDHANRCAPLAAGRAPNFVLLDFVNVGQWSRAVDLLNGFVTASNNSHPAPHNETHASPSGSAITTDTTISRFTLVMTVLFVASFEFLV